MKQYQQELEQRLINLAIKIGYQIKINGSGIMERQLYQQLARSSSSCALNYAEANFSESLSDLIHKLSIVLKELKESKVNMVIIDGIAKMHNRALRFTVLIAECDELIAIMSKSLYTLRQRKFKK